jgi:membrane protease YdiL (CAAX protease family)
MWVAYVLLIPIFEEIFARGFLFAGWERSRVGAPGAVILTTLFWTATHVQYGMVELLQVASAGLLFGLARLHTKSVFPSIVMHAVVNFLALYLVAHKLPF